MGLTVPGKESHAMSRSWRPTQKGYSWTIPIPSWLWMSFQTGSVWPNVHLDAQKKGSYFAQPLGISNEQQTTWKKCWLNVTTLHRFHKRLAIIICFFWFAIPRHREFARAAVQCILDSIIPQAHYLGFVRKEFYAKIHESISSTLYEYWDSSEISGPKQRPRESNTSAPFGFKLLAVNSHGQVVWPDSIEGAFPQGSKEIEIIQKKKAAFLEMCPNAPRQDQPTSTSQPRTSSTPDSSIEDGATPIDPTRMVDLARIPAAEFTAERSG